MSRIAGGLALAGLLLLIIAMNLSRGPTTTKASKFSTEVSEQLNSITARWGSGGEASVLKEEVTELRKRIADLERHLTLMPVAGSGSLHAAVAPAKNRVMARTRDAALSLSPPPPGSTFEPICQVTFGRKVCMRAEQVVSCPGNVDIDRRDGAVPTASGAWRLEASNYTYFMDRGLVAALAKQFVGGSVVEFGAGKGCYTAALRRAGLPSVRQPVGSALGPCLRIPAACACLVAPRAQAAPTQSRAASQQRGGVPWPRELASAGAQEEGVATFQRAGARHRRRAGRRRDHGRAGADGRPDDGAAPGRGRLGALPRGR